MQLKRRTTPLPWVGACRTWTGEPETTMTHLAQPTRGHSIRSTQHAYLATVDFAQDDIIRPELRNEAILASRPSVKERASVGPCSTACQ